MSDDDAVDATGGADVAAMSKPRRRSTLCVLIAALLSDTEARKADAVIDIWPDRAPGETSSSTGEQLAPRPGEDPPATRIAGITRPQLHVFRPPPEDANGAGVLIFPGGGYRYVVVDKEGSEAAAWLNELGVTAFVVRYRTALTPAGPQSDPILPQHSERPLQDAERALRLVRTRATEWNLQPDRIGVLGFSAGAHTAALLSTRFTGRSYDPIDGTDTLSCRPDFALLIYPWLLTEDGERLSAALAATSDTPPAFLVQAHDDFVDSMNSVVYYSALKRIGGSAELHIFAAGGHGYGLRPVQDSQVDTWPQRAADWLQGLDMVE